MSRLTPQHWRTLERVFMRAGFKLLRQASSHRVYDKPGAFRPIIIPQYDEVDPSIINGLLRTANMSRTEYLRLLKD